MTKPTYEQRRVAALKVHLEVYKDEAKRWMKLAMQRSKRIKAMKREQAARENEWNEEFHEQKVNIDILEARLVDHDKRIKNLIGELGRYENVAPDAPPDDTDSAVYDAVEGRYR